MGILYNRKEALVVVPLLLNGKKKKKKSCCSMDGFLPWRKQRSRVVREEFETYVHLFPFFGLN